MVGSGAHPLVQSAITRATLTTTPCRPSLGCAHHATVPVPNVRPRQRSEQDAPIDVGLSRHLSACCHEHSTIDAHSLTLTTAQAHS
jgi:hypothetical protein